MNSEKTMKKNTNPAYNHTTKLVIQSRVDETPKLQYKAESSQMEKSGQK